MRGPDACTRAKDALMNDTTIDDTDLRDEADDFEDAATADFIRRFGSVPL
jgi:hypothetical protein